MNVDPSVNSIFKSFLTMTYNLPVSSNTDCDCICFFR